MRRLTATVSGYVQGVYFRASAQKQATRLAVAGWAANQPDGSVRVVAEGSDDALQQFLSWLQHGPPAARVEHVAVEWSPATGEFRGFQVRH
jgi:acylphosphatase